MADSKRNICLVPGCKRVESYRGICQKCGFDARQIVASGEVTEAWLIAAKLILPRRKRKDRTPDALLRKVIAKIKDQPPG